MVLLSNPFNRVRPSATVQDVGRGATVGRKRWQPLRAPLATLIAVAMPVITGELTAHAAWGLAIGMGAALLSAGAGDQRAEERFPVGPLPAAMVLSIATSWTPWPVPVTLALVASAALLSGYSRPAGQFAMRFAIYLVLATTMIRSAPDHAPWGAGLFALGGLWGLAVQRVLGVRRVAVESSVEGRRVPGPRRLRHSLTSFASWQFALRLVLGLALGWALSAAWPGHHWDWIALTVALLTRRQIEPLPARTAQRVAGTALGVGLAWLLMQISASNALHAGAVIVLAMAVGPARRRSYFAYSVLATPLILAAIDLGPASGDQVLVERLIATIAGGAIVIAGNLLAASAVRRWGDKAAPS